MLCLLFFLLEGRVGFFWIYGLGAHLGVLELTVLGVGCVCMHACMHACMYVCLFCVHLRDTVSVACVPAYIHMHAVHVYITVCACICIYISLSLSPSPCVSVQRVPGFGCYVVVMRTSLVYT